MDGTRVVDAAEFWSTDTAVESLVDRVRLVEYEAALLERAIRSVGGRDDVRSVAVVGVGAGRELAGLLEAIPHAEVVAYDVSQAMVEACRRRVRELGTDRVRVECGAIADLTAPNPFDLVVGFNAVMSYPQPASERARSFAGSIQLLRPGGVAAFVVQQRYGRPDWAVWFLLRKLATALPRVRFDPTNHLSVLDGTGVEVHHFSARELTAELRSAGYGDIECESVRAWSRRAGTHIPTRSPNPLVVIARRPA